MKEIVKKGKVKLLFAKCKECDTEFTFWKSDIQDETDVYANCYPLKTREYVTCPCCHEKIYNWSNYKEK